MRHRKVTRREETLPCQQDSALGGLQGLHLQQSNTKRKPVNEEALLALQNHAFGRLQGLPTQKSNTEKTQENEDALLFQQDSVLGSLQKGLGSKVKNP